MGTVENRELLDAYGTLITGTRFRPSTQKDREQEEESFSDLGRILFCGPFRRLQEKAQVFSLESNAAVRSRLTHSFEVAFIGRLIASKILSNFRRDFGEHFAGSALSRLGASFELAVETACLMHDIGNPPFGHFGESAIQEWFRANWKAVSEKALRGPVGTNAYAGLQGLMADFLEFDGNMQGFRVVTRLQWNSDEFGLNLTHTQLAAYLKYTRSPGTHKAGQRKKASWFLSEQGIRDGVWASLGMEPEQRHPCAYVMEAADDIAYCLSDLEDGVEKGIIAADSCLEAIVGAASEERTTIGLTDSENLVAAAAEEGRTLAERFGGDVKKNAFFHFKTALTRTLVKRAAETYVSHHDEILRGEAAALADIYPPSRIALKALKRVAREHLYTCAEAQNPELAGYRIVTGLLAHFSPLLEAPRAVFESIVHGDSKGPKDTNTDYARRLYNRLPPKYKLNYGEAVGAAPILGVDSHVNEWYQRAHLIVDYISGMTDRYALETYQLLEGIRV